MRAFKKKDRHILEIKTKLQSIQGTTDSGKNYIARACRKKTKTFKETKIKLRSKKDKKVRHRTGKDKLIYGQ